MVPVNVGLWAGTTARRVIGTEVVGPPMAESCTDAETSEGCPGRVGRTSTVPVPPGGRISVEGKTAPEVVKSDVVAENSTGPLKPEPRDSAKYALHVPP